MHQFCFPIGVTLALIWNCGCSAERKGPPPPATVNGTVNIDGKPLPTGELHFAMPGVPASVIQVSKGIFSGEAPIGKNKVEVYIWVEGSASTKYGGTRPKTNTAPEKYSGPNTPLEATVNAGTANEFKFDIGSR